jgi:hypothetical protein
MPIQGGGEIISIMPVVEQPSLVPQPIFGGSGAELVGQQPSIVPQPIFTVGDIGFVGQQPSIYPVKPVETISIMPVIGGGEIISILPVEVGQQEGVISILPHEGATNKLPTKEQVVSILPVFTPENKLPAKDQVSIMPIQGGGEIISIMPVITPENKLPIVLPEQAEEESIVPVFHGGNAGLIGQPSLVPQPIFGGSGAELVGQQPSIMPVHPISGGDISILPVQEGVISILPVITPENKLPVKEQVISILPVADC